MTILRTELSCRYKKRQPGLNSNPVSLSLVAMWPVQIFSLTEPLFLKPEGRGCDSVRIDFRSQNKMLKQGLIKK